MEFILKGETLELLAEKAIYWPSQKALLVTDLHLGKTNHLRKSGFALSMDSQFGTLKNLEELIQNYSVNNVMILGDLFHSTLNNEWRTFEQFRSKHKKVGFILIKGNHDIIDEKFYHKIDVETCDTLQLGPFVFSHEPLESAKLYNIFGHIHPGIVLKGKGRMYTKLPCFYFGEKSGIMPAFGTLTGLAKIKVDKKAKVFAINYPKVIDFS